ncbi:MAG: PEGA domain-containing protein, partial [Candidatus Cloacimonetes bacterium]|nr:PEGA domain-containing protein [Candidatus Cloacimonadota bacterium]
MSRKVIGLAFLIVILFTFISLYSVELNSLSIVGKATQPAGEIVPGDKLDVNKKQAALISFITDLEVDMDFRPWNGAVGKITNPAMGRWNVYVSPDERAIDVHAEGFKPLKVVLSSFGINDLKSGEVYHLELTGDKKFEQIPVMISSNQSEAAVYIDGELLGTTQDKMLTVNVNQGKREIKITKDGFASQSITEDVSVTNNRFNFNMVITTPAVVKIRTDPEGAKVTIEGDMNLGITPLESFYEAGTYAIRIEKENYETINEQISIIEPETKKYYELTDIRATLTVKTYENATVKFNGESYIGGVSGKKIVPQVLQVEVVMPKAETLKRIITLKPKDNETIEMYPEVQTGTIQVTCIPTDAKIELKGDAGEYYTAIGRGTFTEVPVGDYELNVSADKYLECKENFDISEGEILLKQKELVKEEFNQSANIPALQVKPDLSKFDNGTEVTCMPDARKIEFKHILQEGEELNNETFIEIIGTEAANIFKNKINVNDFYLNRSYEDVQKIIYKAELELTNQIDDWEREKNDKEYNMFSAMKNYYQDEVSKNLYVIQMQQDSMAVERFIQEKNICRFEKEQYEKIIKTIEDNKNAHLESSPHRIMLIGRYTIPSSSYEEQEAARNKLTAKLKVKAIELGIEVEKTVIGKLIENDTKESETYASIERADGEAYLHTTFHEAVKINEVKEENDRIKMYSTHYIINIYDVFPRFSSLPSTGEIELENSNSVESLDMEITHDYDIYRFNADSQTIESVIHEGKVCDLKGISENNQSVESVINEMLHYMNIQDNLIESKNDITNKNLSDFVNRQNETIGAYKQLFDIAEGKCNKREKLLDNNDNLAELTSNLAYSLSELKEIETDYEAYISKGFSTSIIKTKTFDTTEFSGSISEGIKEAISFINYDEVYQKLQASRSSTV